MNIGKGSLLLIVFMFCVKVNAESFDPLKGAPSIEKVLSEVKGSDYNDTKARQFATFYQIGALFDVFVKARPSMRYTEAESNYSSEQSNVNGKILQEMRELMCGKGNLNTDCAEYSEWSAKCDFYKTDPEFQQQVLKQFFSTIWQQEFEKAKQTIEQNDRAMFNDAISEALKNYVKPKAIIDSSYYIYLYVVLVLCLIRIVILVVQETKPAGIAVSNPNSYHIGFNKYNFESFTGVVISTDSGVESRLHKTYTTDSEGRSHSDLHTTTHLHREFFVQQKDGKEFAIHLVDSGVQVRLGSIFSALWIAGNGAKLGYFLFYNHNLDEKITHNYLLHQVIKRKSPTFAVFVASWIIFFIGLEGRLQNLLLSPRQAESFSTYLLVFVTILAIIVSLIVRANFHRRQAARRKDLSAKLVPYFIQKFKEKAEADNLKSAIVAEGCAIFPG